MPNPAWTVTSHALKRRGQAEGLQMSDPNFIAERERLRTLIPEEVERARPLSQGQKIFKHPMRLQGTDRAEYRLHQGRRTLCYIVVGRTVVTTILPDDRQLETLEQLGELESLRPPKPVLERPAEPVPEPIPPPAPIPAKAAPDPGRHVPAWVRKPGRRLHLLVDHDSPDPNEPDGRRLHRQWAPRLARLRPGLVVCSEKLLPGVVEPLLIPRDRTPVISFVAHPSPRGMSPYQYPTLRPDLQAWWEGLGAQAVAGRDDIVFLLSSRDARRFNATLNPRCAGFPLENVPPSVHPGKAYRLGWDFHEERLIASPYTP